MNNDSAERRRSDRLWITMPLRAEGVDASGEIAACAGRAVSVNRHGGRIQIPLDLDRSWSISLLSPLGRGAAEFRLVDTITHGGEHGYEYGVECLEEANNFWGIEFPSRKGITGDAKALLDCGTCHTKALMPLAISDVERLEMGGMTAIYCEKCAAMTHWWFAEVGSLGNRETERARSSVEMTARLITPGAESRHRGQPRVCMQMPLWIRGHYGESDEVRTENISKIGLSFSSQRNYLRGEIVTTAFPSSSFSRHTRMPARIVREQVLKGSALKIYGATFEAQRSFKPLGA
ncbi:MAG TPA: hypothetical protein VKV95_07445 [Terriglobia bacterium]|nr:hypothetical protein [Terriglobia bacterium]